MLIANYPSTSPNLVNYTILPTQASNEVYIVETDTPDSTAFLMRNNVFIELTLPFEQEEKDTSKKKEEADASSVYFF